MLCILVIHDPPRLYVAHHIKYQESWMDKFVSAPWTRKGISSYIDGYSISQEMVTALLCFVVVIHWLIFPCPSGLLHWHCDNLTIAPVSAKQPWWILINTCEFIMDDCITTTKQSTTKLCAYFLGYTVPAARLLCVSGSVINWLWLVHYNVDSTLSKI